MLLEVGRVVKPHGLKGEVIVDLSTTRPERVAPGAELATDEGTLVVERSSPHQGRWIVQFAGVAGRDGAEALRGRILRAEPLDDPDELWVHELVGAEVIDTTGTLLGRVATVEANPASDLLVLESGGLIPARFVVEHATDRVVVDPPEGLLD